MELKTMYDYRKYASYGEYVDAMIEKEKQEKEYWKEELRLDAERQKRKPDEEQQSQLQTLHLDQQWYDKAMQISDWTTNTYNKAKSYLGYKEDNKVTDTTEALTKMDLATTNMMNATRMRQENPASRLNETIKQKYPATYASTPSVNQKPFMSKEVQQMLGRVNDSTNSRLATINNVANNPWGNMTYNQTSNDIIDYLNSNNTHASSRKVEQNYFTPSRYTQTDIMNAAKNALDYVLNNVESTTAACNFGVREAFNYLYNPKLLNNKQANDMADYWRNDTTGQWKEVSISNAQELVNQGHFVVASWKNPDPSESGHVALIVPGKAVSRKWNNKLQKVPNCMETGGKKRRWISAPITHSFEKIKQPNVKLYIYNPQ